MHSNMNSNVKQLSNTSTKSKNKENHLIKKMKNLNALDNLNSAQGKNYKNFTEFGTVSPNLHHKRKFDQIENISHQEEIITQTKYLLYKIDELYDKFSSRIFCKEWREEFLFELKQENIVDVSDIFPKSLNTRGSHLLEYTKFWILFIEYKFSELDLIETLSIFNNSITYEQNDIQLLYDYFVKTLEENFERKEIFSILEQKNGVNHFRVPEKLEDMSREHYKFLLEKPEIFKDAKMIKKIYTYTPMSKKAQKLLHELHNFNSCTNSNHRISSLSKSKNESTIKFDLYEYDKQEAFREEMIKSQQKDTEQVSCEKYSNDLVPSNESSKEFKTISIGVNTEELAKESKVIGCNSTYAELVKRNQYELIKEITSNVCYVNEKNKEDNSECEKDDASELKKKSELTEIKSYAQIESTCSSIKDKFDKTKTTEEKGEADGVSMKNGVNGICNNPKTEINKDKKKKNNNRKKKKK